MNPLNPFADGECMVPMVYMMSDTRQHALKGLIEGPTSNYGTNSRLLIPGLYWRPAYVRDRSLYLRIYIIPDFFSPCIVVILCCLPFALLVLPIRLQSLIQYQTICALFIVCRCDVNVIVLKFPCSIWRRRQRPNPGERHVVCARRCRSASLLSGEHDIRHHVGRSCVSSDGPDVLQVSQLDGNLCVCCCPCLPLDLVSLRFTCSLPGDQPPFSRLFLPIH